MSDAPPCDHDLSIALVDDDTRYRCLDCGARVTVTLVEGSAERSTNTDGE